MKANSLTRNEIRFCRSLFTRNGQIKHKCFAIEGFRIVWDTIRQSVGSPYQVREVLVDSVFAEKRDGQCIISLCGRENLRIRIVKKNQLDRIQVTENPQGIMAIISIPEEGEKKWLEDAFSKNGIILALDGIQDPGNTGTLIRSAAAFGVTAVLIREGGAHLYNSKVLRATAGAFLHLPVIHLRLQDMIDTMLRFRKAGFEIAVATTDGDAKPIKSVSPPERIVVIIGNEGSGVCPEIRRLSTLKIAIPISSRIESLNAAIAGSIMLFHLSSK